MYFTFLFRTKDLSVHKSWIVALAFIFLFSCKKESVIKTITLSAPAVPVTPSPASLTPRPIHMSAHCNGFYEYLPEGYENDPAGTRYPLMLVFHGGGEVGEDSSELKKVLTNGPLRLVKAGTFPSSFTVGDQKYKFIIIAPQFTSSGDTYPNEIDGLIEYAKLNYKVDASRIYLTGLSYGGGLCWSYVGENSNYANKIAAMVPIAAYIADERDQFKVNAARAEVIVSSHLPIWSTHNSGDRTCPLRWVTDAYNLLNNSTPLPDPLPKLTIFNSSAHGGWTQTYTPSFKENNMNIYEWMLQYHR